MFRLFKPLFLFVFLIGTIQVSGQSLFKSTSGRIHFISDAPLELIEAETESFSMLVDTAKMEFAISIPIKSFTGFNNPLQQQHFYENYMETDIYESATYAGKILGNISFSPDTLELTAKGKLKIHGEEKLRIIPVKAIWKDENSLQLISYFIIPLKDHDIDIPRVVYQKIAEDIRVDFECILITE
mgnify:CR=1 FL=1